MIFAIKYNFGHFQTNDDKFLQIQVKTEDFNNFNKINFNLK